MNKKYAAEVGRNLKQLRLSKKLVQSDIGMPSLISSVERGNNLPGVETLGRYVALFGLDAVSKALGWKK